MYSSLHHDVLRQVLLAVPLLDDLATVDHASSDLTSSAQFRCAWYARHGAATASPYTWRLVSACADAEPLVLALVRDAIARSQQTAEAAGGRAGEVEADLVSLRHAASRGHLRVVHVLLARTRCDSAQALATRTALDAALSCGATEVATALFDAGWVFDPFTWSHLVALPPVSLEVVLPRLGPPDDDSIHRCLDHLVVFHICSADFVAVLLRFRPCLAAQALGAWLQLTFTPRCGRVLRIIRDCAPDLLQSVSSARMMAFLPDPSQALAALSHMRACGWTRWRERVWGWVRNACLCGDADLLAELFQLGGGPSRLRSREEAMASGCPSWAGLVYSGWWKHMVDGVPSVPSVPSVTSVSSGVSSSVWARALEVVVDNEPSSGRAKVSSAAVAALECVLVAVASAPSVPVLAGDRFNDDITRVLVWRCQRLPDTSDLAPALFAAASLHLHSTCAIILGAMGSDAVLTRVVPLLLPVVALTCSSHTDAREEGARLGLRDALLQHAARLGCVPRQTLDYLASDPLPRGLALARASATWKRVAVFRR